MRRWLGMRSSRGAFLAAVLAVLGVVAGCGGELRTVPLTASRTPFVRDVPVPMSFELVNDMSQSYRTPTHRMIRHAYFGSAEPLIVHAFYRQEMPRSGWRYLGDSSAEGAYQLTFQKASEVAIVHISRETRGWRAGALVMISVKPIERLIGRS